MLAMAALLVSCGGSGGGSATVTPPPAQPAPVPLPVVTLSTIIGPAPGEGVPADAPLARAGGLAIDASGLMYVSDTERRSIYSLTQAGTLTKLAGNMGDPGPLARDEAGNLFVGDLTRISKVSPDGVATLHVGGYFGYQDGPVGVGQLRAVKGMVFDAAGTMFITDNKTVRRITPDRTVFTLAGKCDPIGMHSGDTICASGPSKDGMAGEARFTNPSGIALSGGALYVTDVDAIRKVTLDGQVTTVARIEGASLSGIAVAPDGMIYVVDTRSYTIKRVTPSGQIDIVAEKIGQGMVGYVMELRMLGPDTLVVATNTSVYKITVR
jgi:hypothetical protein